MSREDQIISKLLKDIENSSMDHKLAYVLGRYIELRSIYQHVSWQLTTEMLRGGISGAQVIVGFLNVDLVTGLFSLVIALGSIIFTIAFPEYRVPAMIIAIVSIASTVASLGHYLLRIKKGITPEVAKKP